MSAYGFRTRSRSLWRLLVGMFTSGSVIGAPPKSGNSSENGARNDASWPPTIRMSDVRSDGDAGKIARTETRTRIRKKTERFLRIAQVISNQVRACLNSAAQKR